MTDKALASVDAKLMETYKQNADAGSENLGGAMPNLKLIGKDPEEFKTADGSKAEKGDFYLTSNSKLYKSPEVSIVYTQSAQLPVYNPKNLPELKGQTKFNTIVIGMILEDREPFMMYISGMSLSDLFDWQKSVTTAKASLPIPMYAFVNKLTSHPQKNDWGKFYTKKLELVKVKDQYKIVTDTEVAKILLESIPVAKKATATAIQVANGEKSEIEPGSDSVSEPEVVVDDINF